MSTQSELDKAIATTEKEENESSSSKFIKSKFGTVLIALILLAVVIGAAVYMSGRPQVITGGKDTNYPYAWMIQDDGTLKLSLKNGDDGSYTWALGDFSDETVSVECKDKEGETSKNSVFIITPLREGIARLDLRRVKAENDVEAAVFSLPVSVIIDSELNAVLEIEAGKEFEEIDLAGLTENCEVSCTRGEGGSLVFIFRDKTNWLYSWSANYGGQSLIIDFKSIEGGAARAEISWSGTFDGESLVIDGTPVESYENRGETLPVFQYTAVLSNKSSFLELDDFSGFESDYEIPELDTETETTETETEEITENL